MERIRQKFSLGVSLWLWSAGSYSCDYLIFYLVFRNKSFEVLKFHIKYSMILRLRVVEFHMW